MLIGTAEMPANRHTVKAEIKLSEGQARQLKDDPTMRLMIYCGANSGINPYTAIDIAFPNQIEVKVNNEDVKSNFKGLKSTAGSTKPADITSYVRKLGGYGNQISICYALTKQRFSYMVRLVKLQSAEELAQRIKNASVISKQTVIDEMSRANADPDIAAMSSKMSLKDPVSITRITMPVRSTVCMHNQCFDGRFFMQLQEQAPTWSCPICQKTVSFESLCVDKYFEEILNTTSKSIEQVTIEPDGQWSVDQDDEDKGKSNQARGEARAAWDDDFDDEIVEVLDSPPAKGPTNGVKHEFAGASPMGPPGFSFNTPPLSSREASVARSNASAQRPGGGSKRAASAVIDLTLDDEDEEQPPRPAKRQTTGNPLGGPTSSYNTPSSLPEPTRPQAYLPQPIESSSMFRPYSTGQEMQPPTNQSTFPGSQSPSRASPFAGYHQQQQQYLRPDSQSPAHTNGYGSFSTSMRPPSRGYVASQSPVGQASPQPPTYQQNLGPPPGLTSTFGFPLRPDSRQDSQQQQQQQSPPPQHQAFDFGRTRDPTKWSTNYGPPYPDQQ
jgi:E3 SUMO-protein ligase PIAS1